MDYDLLAGVAAIGLVILYYLIHIISKQVTAYNFSRANGCKSPVRLPQWERIIGIGFLMNLRKATKEKCRLERNFERHEKIGDTFTCTLMGNYVAITRDPEVMKAVLSTQFKDFGLGGRYKTFKDLLGRGIFTADGAYWEHSRALVRPSFARSQVADLDSFEKHVQNMISRIPRNRSTVDLQPLFFGLTLDSSTEFLFGISVNSLSSGPDSPTQYFGQCFDLAQKKLNGISATNPSEQSRKEFLDACKFCHEYIDKYIQNALNALKYGGRSSKEKVELERDVVGAKQKYVFLDELAKSTTDPVALRDELLNILVAGRDTTASLLSNTFHVLARRPDIWAKLQVEIETTLKGERPTYETLRRMKYLKYVLNESLRLYPVVPYNARFATKNTTIPRGGGPDGLSPIFIPEGGIVSYSVWSMHRNPQIYGPTAHEFTPERWANPETSTDLPLETTDDPLVSTHQFRAGKPLRPGWGYLPFNGGPRICVGQQFALTEASYTIVRLVQEFGALECRDERPWEELLGLTVCSANGVLVSLVER